MKSKNLSSFVLTVSFLTALMVAGRIASPGISATVEPAGNERLEATHAWQALKWYNDQRAYPTGRIPVDWREKALAQVERNNLRKISSENSVSWNNVGPNAIGGRVRSIVINPLNPNTIYCGSVSGGIWKSTNAGGSWFPTSDGAANLVIGTMVIDPTDTNTIYAGTGEGYFNVDALRGAGVLKSIDGGAHWNLLTNFPGATSPSFYYYINKLVIRSDAHNTLYAALLGGIWKTTDGGANWAKLTITTASTGCMDLVINPVDNNILYAAFGLFVSDGVYKSTNGGSSWSKLTNGFPLTSTKFGRISLAISQTAPSTLYACVTDSNYYTHSIQKTTNGGGSWFAVATPFDNSSAVNGTHLGGQGWYNNYIAVSPADSNILFTGGINIFRSTNGGAAWTRISDGYGTPYVHVDQHAVAFSPASPSLVYFGNDGGVFRTTDGGATFSAINNNLGITQFYSGAVHPTSEIYYGGTQDNGTLRTTSPPSWSVAIPGDGGATAVDFTTPTTVYSEYVYLSILKSTGSGAPNSWTRAMSGIPTTGGNLSDGTSDRCEFIAPLVMDPSNSQVLVAGTYRIFRTANGGTSWSSISSDLTGDGAGSVGSSGSVITAIAVAKSLSSTIYIGTSGSAGSASRVCVTTNTGSSWTDVTKAPLPNLYVKSIAIDPANRDRAIVTYSGYGAGHVFLTANRGSSWTNISGDLPDLPVNTVVIDPSNTGHWIIGTDLGVFESNNGGTNWIQQNSGLANVSVSDLDVRGDLYMFAATHGRGMFKTTAPINVAARVHLTLSVHQNPALSQYVDIYVLSDTALQGPPSLQVSSGNTTLAVTQTSPGVYRGSFQLTGSGTVTITASALDPGGNTLSAQRTFQATLLKRGVAQTISSPGGDASVLVPAGALTEDTYFTIVPEEGPGGDIPGRVFTVGPARDFQSALTISMRYDPARVDPGKEGSLTIVRSDGSGWVPVESRVDVRQRSVLARVSTLGSFAIAYSGAPAPGSLPEAYRLAQNFPNPFNPVTSIEYAMREPAHVLLKVYDVTGREVATLADADQDAGTYHISWDGRGQAGTAMASGVYFYRLSLLQSGKTIYMSTKKMLLAR
jgi:photosystem II stability/assembly factor-like uncharacterized protein